MSAVDEAVRQELEKQKDIYLKIINEAREETNAEIIARQAELISTERNLVNELAGFRTGIIPRAYALNGTANLIRDPQIENPTAPSPMPKKSGASGLIIFAAIIAAWIYFRRK